MRFSAWAVASLILSATAAPAFAQDKPLELTIEGRRDWDLNGLFNTKKGAFAGYAALTKSFLAMGSGTVWKAGAAWEMDKITVVLTPDGKGGFVGTGIWNAISMSPPATFASAGGSAKAGTTVTINGLTPVLKGTLSKGQMRVPVDVALQGATKDGRQQTAYMHLDIVVDWRDGTQKGFTGRDEYGAFKYTASVRQAALVRPAAQAAPKLSDAELCTASILASHNKLKRPAVTTQCGCFTPKFRASLSVKDFDGWRRAMEMSLDKSSATQRGGDLINLMSQMGSTWIDRIDAADRATQKVCKIADWN